MSKENGVTLSPTVLGILITACLSVGSGGAFLASRAESAPIPVFIEHQQQHGILQERVSVLEAVIRENKERLQRIEMKLDQALSR
jgi:hypothetical protein